MSHNVKITGIKITDLDALDSAIAELRAEGIGIRLERGPLASRSLTFRTYRAGSLNDDRAHHVIRLDNCKYDIGLIRQPSGHYLPVYDNALGISVACPIAAPGGGNNYNMRAITDAGEVALAARGIGIGKLMQRYSTRLAEMEAKRRGYTSRRVPGENGALHLEITVGG